MHVASLILKHEMWFVLGECSHVLGKETHLTGLSSSRLTAVLAHTEDKVEKYSLVPRPSITLRGGRPGKT